MGNSDVRQRPFIGRPAMTALFSAENQKIGALTESRVAYAYYSYIQKKPCCLCFNAPVFSLEVIKIGASDYFENA